MHYINFFAISQCTYSPNLAYFSQSHIICSSCPEFISPLIFRLIPIYDRVHFYLDFTLKMNTFTLLLSLGRIQQCERKMKPCEVPFSNWPGGDPDGRGQGRIETHLSISFDFQPLGILPIFNYSE